MTLQEELADLRRELKLREVNYPRWRNAVTDPSKVAIMLREHTRQIACTKATIARLEALIPKQESLF